MRRLVLVLLYGALLVACATTLSDWRIRLAAVAIVGSFAGRSLWRSPSAGPGPEGRAADVAPEAAGETSGGAGEETDGEARPSVAATERPM